MRFIVFLIRISALPGWRVYTLILSQQKFKIVRALYTRAWMGAVYSTVQLKPRMCTSITTCRNKS